MFLVNKEGLAHHSLALVNFRRGGGSLCSTWPAHTFSLFGSVTHISGPPLIVSVFMGRFMTGGLQRRRDSGDFPSGYTGKQTRAVL